MMRTRTILIIDDDPPQRDLVRDILEEEGFRVIAVGDAADALTRMSDVAIDLVLLDLVMPRARMDGFAFLSEIRSRPDLIDTPLVILSGLGAIVAEAIDPATAQALRIAFVAPKPFAIADLVREIRRILGEPEDDDVSTAEAQ
jgi:CheY-like chemotaxis protein